MRDRTDKWALVTGGSGGIGRAFALGLSKTHRVTAVARNEEKLRTLVAEMGEGHSYVVADLATDDGQTRTARELGSRHFDLLVNNAGAGLAGDFTGTKVERTISMMHLNCDALVRLSHAFLGQAQRGDALINVSSTLAFLPMATFAAYSATKAFVTAFSEALWYEQKERGVYVMGLCPGLTSSDFQVNAGGRVEDLPRNLIETPEQVVATALRALRERKDPTVISGAKNAIFAQLMTRLMPRKTAVNIMGAQAAKSSP